MRSGLGNHGGWGGHERIIHLRRQPVSKRRYHPRPKPLQDVFEILDPASYAFNAYAIPLLATMVAMLLLGVFVLFRERGSREAVCFSLVAGSISIWLGCFSVLYLAVDERVALVWARSAYLGICLIPAALYGFAVAVTRSRRRWLVRAGWLLSAGFALASAGAGPGEDLYHYWWGFYPRFRWLGVPFLAFFFLMLALSLHEYWRDYRLSSPGITVCAPVG